MTPYEEVWCAKLSIAVGIVFLMIVFQRVFREETYHKIMIVICGIWFILDCTVWKERVDWLNRITALLLAWSQYLWLRKIRASSR